VQNDLWVKLRARLAAAIDPETDSLRFYFLGNKWQERIEHIGAKPAYNPEGPLIV
jgi:CRISPR-associated protein Cas2